MKIKFEGSYKSLHSFESDELNKFSVITGKNGCGKSQLIQLLDFKAKNTRTPEFTTTLSPDIKIIQSEGLENPQMKVLNNGSWKTKFENKVNQFIELGPSTKRLSEIIIKANVWIDEITPDNIFSLIPEERIDKDDLILLLKKSVGEFSPNFLKTPKTTEAIVFEFKNISNLNRLRKTFEVADYVKEFRKKNLHELTQADFLLTPLPDHFINNPQLFQSELEVVFYNYAKRRDQNRRLFFDKKVDGDINGSISDEEFTNKHPAPWDSINKILHTYNIDFKFIGIEKSDFSPDTNVAFKLNKQDINKEIQLSELSSGEKVILGLIIKLFTSDHYKDKLEYPDLITLDEPDAHLHPEMSKLLIDILNNTFVNDLGIHVIMVTHSPSTIALCPDDCIYELQNYPVTSLEKIEKEHALNILTGHLPTLSIDYENHKQVFVESPTDVYYYQTIFNKLNEEHKFSNRLYFISNSRGKGNSSQVKKLVNDIRESGNKTSFGIVDWDLTNKSSEFIKVHGENERYSIENYLYDPIYSVILLMRLEAHNVFNELGFDIMINEYKLGELDIERIQFISDWFFEKVSPFIEKQYTENKKMDKLEYHNGAHIQVPNWFLTYSGHDFEKRIKSAFSAIEGKFRAEGELQKELTLIMGKSFPFIPKSSVDLIKSILYTFDTNG